VHVPMGMLACVQTPTMLMTGEVDCRTPSTEAEQFTASFDMR
jgi:hypothetical protein